MTVLSWNELGTRFYETGIDRVVLYPTVDLPAVWNGVVSIDEKIIGGDVKPFYRDGIKYINFPENADFQATLTAFSAPVEFRRCEGRQATMKGLVITQQPRSYFGLSYRTLRMSDVDDTGYKIHLVYNCLASPSSRNHQSLSDSTDPIRLQWTIDTIPVRTSVRKPTAHLIIDSTLYSPSQIAQIEDLLHGTDTTEPTLPSQTVIADILGGP